MFTLDTCQPTPGVLPPSSALPPALLLLLLLLLLDKLMALVCAGRAESRIRAAASWCRRMCSVGVGSPAAVLISLSVSLSVL
jgi:hypothetical protein